MTEQQKRVSNSELQAYKRCRRKWYLAYHRRLKLRREDPTGARSIGTRVHSVLAFYYEPGQRMDAAGIAAALALHDGLVADDQEAFPEQAGDIAKEGDLSRAIIEGYFQWVEETGADEGLTIVGAETPLEYEMPGGVILQGKLDVQIHREFDDAAMVLDHKTVQEFTTPTRTLGLDEQMKTYLLLKLLNDPDTRIDGAIYNMLRKVKRTASAKPPFFQRFEVRYNKHVLREFYERIVAEIADVMALTGAVERGETWKAYPSPNRNCSWDCDFYGVCGLMDDKSTHVEGLLEALYEAGDPYARYQADTTI